MHRYEELEKLYYRKKYTKYFFIFISLLSITGVVFYILYFQPKPLEKQIKKPEIKPISKIETKEKNKTKIVKVKEIKTEQPKKNVVKKTKPKETIKKPKIIEKLELNPIFPIIDINHTKIKKEIKKIKQPPKIKIEIKSAKQTLNTLIYLYNKSPNYKRAIKIAKIYLNKQNYKKSIKWAKEANKLMPEKYESWYIFAKSLIKLGKTKKAKDVLIAYLDNYGADKHIEELLRSLK
jgi:tetratricopeptide (TPR) repeat protein